MTRMPGIQLRSDCRLSARSGCGLGRDCLPHIHRQHAVLLRKLQVKFALPAVGGELRDQLAFGGERLEPFQPVLKICHRRIPIKRLKDDKPKPGKYVTANIVIG